jgi:hypothetical protein
MAETSETPKPVEVDPLGPDRLWADLRPMVGFLCATGAVLTLATRKNWTWAYILGLLMTAAWVAGFIVSRNKPQRWYSW